MKNLRIRQSAGDKYDNNDDANKCQSRHWQLLCLEQRHTLGCFQVTKAIQVPYAHFETEIIFNTRILR